MGPKKSRLGPVISWLDLVRFRHMHGRSKSCVGNWPKREEKKKDKKAHGRMLGIIRLIRELYKLKMLTEWTMH